jgi:Flp pilus assembly protein TadG
MPKFDPSRNALNGQGNRRGSVTLEFAFGLLVILFPLMFGVIDFSRAAYDYHWVANAARDGSRWMSVRGASCVGLSGGCPAASNDVQTFLQGQVVPGMSSANVTATATWSGKGGDGSDCTNGGNQGTNSAGCVVAVSVNYTFHFSFPYLSSVTGRTLTLNSVSKMIISQ